MRSSRLIKLNDISPESKFPEVKKMAEFTPFSLVDRHLSFSYFFALSIKIVTFFTFIILSMSTHKILFSVTC